MPARLPLRHQHQPRTAPYSVSARIGTAACSRHRSRRRQRAKFPPPPTAMTPTAARTRRHRRPQRHDHLHLQQRRPGRHRPPRPPPGPGQAAQTTTTSYDTSLRARKITYPDSTSVTNVFDPTGPLTSTSGSRTYPVAYAYDYAGRMKTMTTWTNSPPARAPRPPPGTTTPTAAGSPASTYADGHRPDLHLHPRRPPRTAHLGARHHHRPTPTTAPGPGHASPIPTAPRPVTYTYDRRGRRQHRGLGNSVMTSLRLQRRQQLLSEAYSGGILAASPSPMVTTRTSGARPRRPEQATPLAHDVLTYDCRLPAANRHTHGTSAGHVYLSCQLAAGGADCVYEQRHCRHDDDQTIRLPEPPDAAFASVPVGRADSASPTCTTPPTSACGPACRRFVLALYLRFAGPGDQRPQVFGRTAPRWPASSSITASTTSATGHATEAGGDQNGATCATRPMPPTILNQYTQRTCPAAVDIMGIALPRIP